MEIKNELQRVGLLAVLTSIMSTENDTPLPKVKTAIASTLAEMIDLGVMVEDTPTLMLAMATKDFLEQEKLVAEANGIVNPQDN